MFYDEFHGVLCGIGEGGWMCWFCLMCGVVWCNDGSLYCGVVYDAVRVSCLMCVMMCCLE